LPKAERAALINADAKLGAFGPRLGYPHTSAVRDAGKLRELRPRAASESGTQCMAGAVPPGR